MGTPFRQIPILFLLSFILTACFPPITPDVGPRGTVRFNGEPADATLVVDETRLGPVKMFLERGVLLKPGTHRVILAKDGYFDEYLLIEVVEDQVETIDIELRPIPE